MIVGLAEGGRHLDVEVMSSRRNLRVTLNSVQVLDARIGTLLNDGTQAMGLHLLTLNQHSGAVIMKKTFNTTEFAAGLALYPVLTSIAAGRIAIFAVLAEASLNLARVTRQLLAGFGVHSASVLRVRNYLACVLTVGGVTHGDAAVLDADTISLNTFASPVIFHAVIPLSDPDSCSWMKDNNKRKKFCSQYDGYGDFCDCENPLPLDFPKQKLANSVIENIPVLIIAGNRPTELYRSIRSLLEQPGGAPEKILVTVEGDYPEVFQLLNLLQIRYQSFRPALDYSTLLDLNDTRVFYAARISRHYHDALQLAFRLHPNAPAVILLEEDLIASPDFLSFFNQTAFLLASDPSLYCISAWNDLGALHTSRDTGLLMRVETMVGNGWMLTRRIFQEVEGTWPMNVGEGDWDMWLRIDENAAQRECVIPAVSRVFHYGLTGAHVRGPMTIAHFAGHLTTSQPNIWLKDTHKLVQTEYEKSIYELLESPNIVFHNTSLSPCNKNYLPKNFTETLVIFFEMTQGLDKAGWALLAACLGLWHLDTRGHHRGLFRFNYYNTTVLAIGYPFSDYSYLKPPKICMPKKIETTTELQLLDTLVVENRRRHRVADLEEFLPSLMLDVRIPSFAYS
ncbi:protein O-linked-mannose beta-1,2-N-acetylglucosaminyltransferase 1 isoform X2 [Hyalella azteca]|nr:protein O-linked-mannose beta-1,2-N-acetylglucosaminyltransferase 1 isoform X2 [Hyalella azteca]